MGTKKSIATALLLSMLSYGSVFAGTNYSFQQTSIQPGNTYNYNQTMNYTNGTPLTGSVVTVPSGATFNAVLSTPLSSQTTGEGSVVTMYLNQDFYYNDKLIAPAGSTVQGTVITSSKAKRGNMNGKLCVKFTQIVTPVGTQIPITGVIKTDDNSGVLVGGTKKDVTKEYVKDLAAGSAVGALSGLVFGALASGDKLGRGVALGTAVGAGGGLAKSVWDKGNDVEIPANSSVDILLTQPITTSASNYSFQN